MPDPLSEALLRALLQAPQESGMSVPRLGKRLGLGASAVMRQLSRMGDAVLGDEAGPGWVRVRQADDRWVAHLTDSGREQALLPLKKRLDRKTGRAL